jgi:stearoyl-CoA desaturase (delta-9 desaturase)
MQTVLVEDDGDISRRKKLVKNSPYIRTRQRRHFLIFDAIPNIVVLLAIPYHMFIPVRVSDLVVFFLLWAVTGLGVTVGYHRMFTHRAFTAPGRVRAVLAFCGALAGQGPVISWAAIHRRHHELSDEAGDPHSPNLHGRTFMGTFRGLLHAHYTWMFEHDYPNAAHYTADLLKDRSIQWVNRNYYPIAIGGVFVPGLVCGVVTGDPLAAVSGILWGGFIRIVVLGHTIWAINSVLHRVGSRPFVTTDNSHNSAFAALLTFGESWHNNHHAFPTSAKFGLRHGWSDPGWWTVVVLKRFGLVSDIRQPSDSLISQRLLLAHRIQEGEQA